MLARQTPARPPVACMSVPVPKRPRGRPFADKNKGLRARAWWLMRQLKRFTLDDLLLTVAKAGEQGSSNLGKFISALERTGVLVRLQRRQAGTAPTSNGHVIWALAKDLGPMAPVWRSKTRQLFDPNTGNLLNVVNASGEACGPQPQPQAQPQAQPQGGTA